MRGFTKSSLPVLFLLTVGVLCRGQAGAGGSARNYRVGGAVVTVLVPAGMRVEITPGKLETHYEASMFYYTFKTREKGVTYDLLWKAAVTDTEGNVISEEQWRDVGEWASGSVASESTVFDYDGRPGTKLNIVLERVVSSEAVKTSSEEVDGSLFRRLSSGRERVTLSSRAEAQTPLTAADEVRLVERSLSTVLDSEDLKRDLGAGGPHGDYLLTDELGPLAYPPGLTPITKEQVREQVLRQEPVRYFAYCCYEPLGKTVNIVINYHAPRHVGNLHVRSGTRLKFSYRDEGGQLTLTGITTERF